MTNTKNLEYNRCNAIILGCEIEKIIAYIDRTIEARDATEPNALCIRNLLTEALKKAKK